MSRFPSELGADDLVLSHFTLPRHHPIEDRVRAAASAGIAGLSLFVLDEVDPARLADLLDETGLCLWGLEVLRGWAGGPDGDVAAERERHAFELADRFASRCVQAIGPYEGTVEDAGRSFAALCDRAAAHGLDVALEPLPYTNIPDVATALEVVERADRANGGLCLDIWHHVRVGEDRSVLGTVPAGRIVGVQVNDGPVAPPTTDLADYKDDCLRHRVPPGDGEMGAIGFVAAVLQAGSTVPWSVEVCDDSVGAANGAAHVRRCADAMRAVLAQARASS